MRREQVEQARTMLAQGVPERFVAGSLDVSATTLRHCLELAEEFEKEVRPSQTAEDRASPAAEGAQGSEGSRAAQGSPGPSHGVPSGFTKEEEMAYQDAVAAGKVQKIENGEWPDRNLFNPYRRDRQK